MKFTISLCNNRKIKKTENIKDICAFLKEKVEGCTPHLSDFLENVKPYNLKSGESKEWFFALPSAPCPALSGMDKYTTWVTITRTE